MLENNNNTVTAIKSNTESAKTEKNFVDNENEKRRTITSDSMTLNARLFKYKKRVCTRLWNISIQNVNIGNNE